ncbi:MAG: hypothetical protein GY832_41200 [Chloroflexi bacterium]|nr:hypothetical protein [Chloroflexota bacterium]
METFLYRDDKMRKKDLLPVRVFVVLGNVGYNLYGFGKGDAREINLPNRFCDAVNDTVKKQIMMKFLELGLFCNSRAICEILRRKFWGELKTGKAKSHIIRLKI